jgi:tetratricopeptide (TPR) repeat protein
LHQLQVFSGGQPCPLTNIVVVYDEAQEFRNVLDGKIAAIRGWSNHHNDGKANTAIIATRLRRAPDDDLTFELHFSRAQWPQHNLGRFRLSVSGDAAAFERAAAMKLTNPWLKLALAYAVTGRNDEAYQHFSKALERADGYEARKPIVEAAAGFREVLAALVQRQPADPQLQLALARQHAERGKQLLAQKQPAQAQAELEKSGEILTRLRAKSPWTVLTPTEMKSQGGETLMVEKDGSIFVSGPNPDRAVYTLKHRIDLPTLTAIRLETLPDGRLLHGGAGRYPGNGDFHLAEFTAAFESGQADAKPIRIEFGSAMADFFKDPEVHGPAKSIDGNPRTWWETYPRVRETHWAVFVLKSPARMDGRSVSITLDSGISPWGMCGLGRFRLSVTNDADLARALVRNDLKDSEVVDLRIALGKAHAQQGHINEAVASFTEAFDLATDRAAKAKIIAEAAPLEGVLEKLGERAAGDGQFQAELGRHYGERGNAPLAQAARTKARTLFEEKLAKEPENSAGASELAQLLLDQQEKENAARWTVLKPTEMKSKGGATLTQQGDGSILASGVNASGDLYTVSAVSNLDRIATVRLEALPDPSLPNKGPGRHSSGNFQLSAFRLYRPSKEGGRTALPVESAWASFDYKAFDADIAGTVNEKLKKVWHVWGRFGEAHQAVFLVRDAAGGRDLPFILELHHKLSDDGLSLNLGRFRLSVSGDPAVFVRERNCFAARKMTDPWARLAAVWHIVGDRQALERLLEHHPGAAAGIGDLYAAVQDWQRAIVEYSKGLTAQPADRGLLAKLAAAYQSAGRTREAVPHLARASAVNPKDTLLSLQVAALQAWFGQEKELAATRQRILAFARDTNDAWTAERAAKACSIRPSTDEAELAATLPLARKAVQVARGEPWNLVALGMAEYRSGHDAAAEKALLAAAQAGPNNPHSTCTAAFYRAMSLFRQGKKDEARKLATAAAAKMKPPPADEKDPLANLPVMAGGRGSETQEYLITWLTFKEAKALIQFDATPPPKAGNDNN